MAGEYAPFNQVNIQQRPWGPAAGVDASQMEQQADQAQRLTLERMLTENQQGQANLQRYQAQTPNEILKSNLEGLVAGDSARIPGYGREVGLGNVGEAQSRAAKGSFDKATLGSHTMEGNAANYAKAFEMTARHLEMASMASPMMAQAEWSRFLELVPPEHRDIFPKQFTPETPGMLKKLSENLLNTPEHRRKMEEIEGTGKWHREVATIYANAKVQTAGTHIKTLEQELRNARSPGQRLAVAQMIEENEDAPELLLRQARVAAQQSATELAATLGVRIPAPLPGMPEHSAKQLIDIIRRQTGDKANYGGGGGGQGGPVIRYDARGNRIP